MKPAPWVVQLLTRHQADVARTWAQLALRGIDETTPIALDFHFAAPGQTAADRFAEYLQAETPWRVGAVSFTAGVGGPKQWEVSGQTRRRAVSPQDLTEWVTWMVIVGADHGCRFGTWAAADPP